MTGTKMELNSDPVGPESSYDDFYDRYEDYPGGLPEDMSPETFSCLPAEDCVSPPTSTACEVDEFIDSSLVEPLLGIMPKGLRDAGIAEADYVKALPYLAGDGADPTQTERELLFAPAILLLEAGWQSQLKRISGYSQGHLQQVFSGKRAVTAELKTALLNAYREEIHRCEEKASRGWAGIIKIIEAEQ